MSMIKDGAHKYWARQQPDLLPLAHMRQVEDELARMQAKTILVVGLDLTIIAIMAYAKEAGAKVCVVLPRNMALTRELRRVSVNLCLDSSDLVEAGRSVAAWPVELPEVAKTERNYDCVFLMGYGRAEPRHRKTITDQVAPLVHDGSAVFVYPCGKGPENQLLEDFSAHTKQFDIQRSDSMACLRIGTIEVKPAAPPESAPETEPIAPPESAPAPETEPIAPQPQTLVQDALAEVTDSPASDVDEGKGEGSPTSGEAATPAEDKTGPEIVDVSKPAPDTASDLKTDHYS